MLKFLLQVQDWMGLLAPESDHWSERLLGHMIFWEGVFIVLVMPNFIFLLFIGLFLRP